jgi:TolB-like protein/DNA-binding winged helix-turn-helix (wHTH) protein/Flp pilus assembly protein TadD
METSSQIFRFGPFEAKACAQELSKNGTKIKLRGHPFLILEVLLERAGEVVTREEIRRKLWPADTFVDFEHGLNTSIKKLRQVLCDSATEPRYIETLPRLGYRFIAPVETGFESSTGKAAGATSEIPAGRKSGNAIAVQGSARPAFFAGEHGRGRPRLHLFLSAIVLLAGVGLILSVAGSREWFFALFRSTRNASVAVASAKPLRSIAVLPLQNLSNNPEEDYFADGMTDELTTDLAQFGSLRVISRTSAIHYKGAGKTAPEIGRELGVDTLIEGTVQRVGNRVRIRVQLIDSASDRHLWARSYDHELKDVLVLQSSAARDIAEEVQGKVAFPQADARAINVHPVEPDAYEAYLKGRYFWNRRTEEGLKKSIDYFQQAISRDPKFAAAYAGLADSYSILGSDVLPAGVASSKAHVAANRALQLDPTIAEGHAELGLVEFYYDWNWTGSEQEFRRAIELNPNYATAHQWYSYYLAAMGRSAEALEEARRAQQIDPLSLSINTTLAGRYRDLRQYDQAIDLSRRTLEMDPNFVPAHIALGAAYEEQEIWRQAIGEYQKAVQLSQNSPPALASLGYAYALAGNQDDARKVIAALREASKRRYVSAFDMAIVFAGVGDRDSAFGWLEKAYAERESQMPFLSVSRRLDRLRPDPRFANLLQRMGLPVKPASN